MKAIIYAAGIGERLESKFKGRQKLLLEFGRRSLLDWHFQRLKDIGASEVVVVTGFLHEEMETATINLGRKYQLVSRTVFNPDYTEGSVLSVAVSLPELEKQLEPVLLMDGDVLYPTDLVRRLWQSRFPTSLLIDRGYSTADDDPVLVPVRHGKPIEFRKKWTGMADFVGESVGFFKIHPCDLPLLIEETRKRMIGERRKESYDEIVRALILAGCFGVEDVTGLPWTEIDFPEDVEYAETKILPAILEL